MVDFCIFVDPQDPKTIEQIDELRARLPDESINQTDYAPLCRLPMAVSIETKRSANHWETATLQMGTWQSAQLRAMRHWKLGGSQSDLDYVPGLIVLGHDWYFVATVCHNEKTVRNLTFARFEMVH